MSDYDNNFTGIISKNTKKTEPNHADFNGSGTYNGEEFWINGWTKKRKDGSGSFMSLSFRKKDIQPGEKIFSSSESSSDDEFDF